MTHDVDQNAEDWQARLAEQAAAYLARRWRRRADRAERQERRQAGLRARHAAKLSHQQQEDRSA